MASVLAATLIVTNTNRNEAKPGDTISFRFSSPPKAATDVVITIQQGKFKPDGSVERIRPLATFKGSIRDNKYVPASATNLTGRVSRFAAEITLSDGTNQLKVRLIDRFRAVIRNELQITVSGKVGGARDTFAGREPFFVKYPLVMIIPSKTAVLDTSLNFVSDWSARQWQRHDPTFRTVQTVTTFRSPNRAPRSGDYDSVIAAFRRAVNDAPGGIVALAIGHGDGGEGNDQSVAWCDLAPEDARLRTVNGVTRIPHSLFIIHPILADGGVPGKLPVGQRSTVLLDALDRIADVLATATTPVRKLLLHTCEAGENKDFIQLFADRVRVPVQAHTNQIEYEGFLNRGHMNAHYKGEGLTPTGEFDWPLSQTAVECLPSATAPRRFPVVTG